MDNQNDKINVEEIMETIRENVRNKKNIDKHSIKTEVYLHKSQNKIQNDIAKKSIQFTTDSLNSEWDIRNNSYFISSHHPFIGKVLIKCRKLIHGEVRRYVDPVILTQSKFNKDVTQLFTQIENTLSQIKNDSIQKENTLKQIIATLEEHIRSENANFISGLDIEIENKLRLVTILDKQFQSRLRYTSHSDTPFQEKSQINYLSFEEHFRGSRQTIKERQHQYLPFFEHCSNVLDIGCGRGEFLELLKEHDIGGIGIDINKDMVEYCQLKGLDTKQTDALEYLNTLEDTILDGIFSDQVIEHLTPDYLIRLLHLAHQKLKPESYLILGTVNILNPGGLANFFVDPTHISPIHPEYLKYCLEVSGFRDVQVIFRTYDERENNQNTSDLCLIAADYTMVGKK
jgi:O-antigen chain-terminating methyltransferase